MIHNKNISMKARGTLPCFLRLANLHYAEKTFTFYAYCDNYQWTGGWQFKMRKIKIKREGAISGAVIEYQCIFGFPLGRFKQWAESGDYKLGSDAMERSKDTGAVLSGKSLPGGLVVQHVDLDEFLNHPATKEISDNISIVPLKNSKTIEFLGPTEEISAFVIMNGSSGLNYGNEIVIPAGTEDVLLFLGTKASGMQGAIPELVRVRDFIELPRSDIPLYIIMASLVTAIGSLMLSSLSDMFAVSFALALLAFLTGIIWLIIATSTRAGRKKRWLKSSRIE